MHDHTTTAVAHPPLRPQTPIKALLTALSWLCTDIWPGINIMKILSQKMQSNGRLRNKNFAPHEPDPYT